MPIGRLHTVLSLTHTPKGCNRRVADRAEVDALFLRLGIAIIFWTGEQIYPSVQTTGREAIMAVQETLMIDTLPPFPILSLPTFDVTGTEQEDWDDEEEDEDDKEKDEEGKLEKDEEEEDEDGDLIQSRSFGVADD